MRTAEEDFSTIIEPIKGKMKGAIFRIVQDPDDAVDAFQDALLRAWKYWGKIISHPNPQGYIMNICITVSYDLLRKKAKITSSEKPLLYDIESPQVDASPSALNKEIVQLVHEALLQLPPRQANAMFLRLFEEESFSQISIIMNCSESTVRSQMSKGLVRLRKILSKYDILLSDV